MELILKNAEIFAREQHRHQLYGDNLPYSYHLEKTVNVCRYYRLGDQIEAACWLHDILEDTAVSYADLGHKFGYAIADIVYSVTDEVGKNRKEKKEKTFTKLTRNPKGILVKFCDRIANVEACKEFNNLQLLEMYKKELIYMKDLLEYLPHGAKLLGDSMYSHLEQIFKG